MTDFAAIDFETANDNHSSICAVGVVVVRDGAVKETFYSLIHPTPNYYGTSTPVCMAYTNATHNPPPDFQRYGHR